MRGALEPLAGVEIVGLQAQKKTFEVKYDPKKHTLESILAALEQNGERAKKVD